MSGSFWRRQARKRTSPNTHGRVSWYWTYHRNGRRFGFFPEFDRGTMNRRSYFKKLSANYDYAITCRFERDYYGYPTILILTTSNRAEERIARVARTVALGRCISLPLLLTCRRRIDDPTNPHGLLGSIWRVPDADFDDRRCWLPDQSQQLHPHSSNLRFISERQP